MSLNFWPPQRSIQKDRKTFYPALTGGLGAGGGGRRHLVYHVARNRSPLLDRRKALDTNSNSLASKYL